MKNKYIKWSLITVIWLLLWQVIAMAVSNTLTLPSPVDTVRALFALLADGKFYIDAAATIGRCVAAILMSLAFGFLLSLAAYRSRAIRDFLALPVALFKAVPVMAVAIYMILLLTAGNVPILVCFVMCFPIVYTNLLTGLDSMDKNLLEMAQIYNIRGRQLIKHVYMPMLYPHFKSAMSLVAGMSWKAIVTAEVLSIPKFSLGYELMNAKYYLNTDVLFAYVAIIIAISVLFEKFVKHLINSMEPRAYDKSKIKAKSELSRAPNHNNTKYAIELDNISKSFDGKTILKEFNLKLERGEVAACMGASGSGKTTLLRIIAGLETADSGRVEINANRISVLFQEDRLLPWLNVYDNLAIVNNDDAHIRELLDVVELTNEMYKLPGELSGGMKYRLAMARTFAHDGDLLLIDEPFQGLDAETKQRIIDKLWKKKSKKKTIFLITHSEDDKKLANRTIYLQ